MNPESEQSPASDTLALPAEGPANAASPATFRADQNCLPAANDCSSSNNSNNSQTNAPITGNADARVPQANARTSSQDNSRTPARTIRPINFSKLQEAGLGVKIAQALGRNKRSDQVKRLLTEMKHIDQASSADMPRKLYRFLKPAEKNDVPSTSASASPHRKSLGSLPTRTFQPLDGYPKYVAAAAPSVITSAPAAASASIVTTEPPSTSKNTAPRQFVPPKITITAPEASEQKRELDSLSSEQRMKHVKGLLHNKILQKVQNQSAALKKQPMSLSAGAKVVPNAQGAGAQAPMGTTPARTLTPGKLPTTSRPMEAAALHDGAKAVQYMPSGKPPPLILNKHVHLTNMDAKSGHPKVSSDAKAPVKVATPQKLPQDVAKKLDFTSSNNETAKNKQKQRKSAPSSFTAYKVHDILYNRTLPPKTIPKASITSADGNRPVAQKPNSAIRHRNIVPEVSPLKAPYPTANVPKETPLANFDTFKKPYPIPEMPCGYAQPQMATTAFNYLPPAMDVAAAKPLDTVTTNGNASNSLIVLENKVLSHEEMIDLTALRLSSMEQPSSFAKPHKPIPEVMIKQENPEECMPPPMLVSPLPPPPPLSASSQAMVQFRSGNQLAVQSSDTVLGNALATERKQMETGGSKRQESPERLIIHSSKNNKQYVVNAQELNLSPKTYANLTKQVAPDTTMERAPLQSAKKVMETPVQLVYLQSNPSLVVKKFVPQKDMAPAAPSGVIKNDSDKPPVQFISIKKDTNVNRNTDLSEPPPLINISPFKRPIKLPQSLSIKKVEPVPRISSTGDVPNVAASNRPIANLRKGGGVVIKAKSPPSLTNRASPGTVVAGGCARSKSIGTSSSNIHIANLPDPAHSFTAVEFLASFENDNILLGDDQMELTEEELYLSMICEEGATANSKSPVKPLTPAKKAAVMNKNDFNYPRVVAAAASADQITPSAKKVILAEALKSPNPLQRTSCSNSSPVAVNMPMQKVLTPSTPGKVDTKGPNKIVKQPTQTKKDPPFASPPTATQKPLGTVVRTIKLNEANKATLGEMLRKSQNPSASSLQKSAPNNNKTAKPLKPNKEIVVSKKDLATGKVCASNSEQLCIPRETMGLKQMSPSKSSNTSAPDSVAHKQLPQEAMYATILGHVEASKASNKAVKPLPKKKRKLEQQQKARNSIVPIGPVKVMEAETAAANAECTPPQKVPRIEAEQEPANRAQQNMTEKNWSNDNSNAGGEWDSLLALGDNSSSNPIGNIKPTKEVEKDNANEPVPKAVSDVESGQSQSPFKINFSENQGRVTNAIDDKSAETAEPKVQEASDVDLIKAAQTTPPLPPPPPPPPPSHDVSSINSDLHNPKPEVPIKPKAFTETSPAKIIDLKRPTSTVGISAQIADEPKEKSLSPEQQENTAAPAIVSRSPKKVLKSILKNRTSSADLNEAGPATPATGDAQPKDNSSAATAASSSSSSKRVPRFKKAKINLVQRNKPKTQPPNPAAMNALQKKRSSVESPVSNDDQQVSLDGDLAPCPDAMNLDVHQEDLKAKELGTTIDKDDQLAKASNSADNVLSEDKAKDAAEEANYKNPYEKAENKTHNPAAGDEQTTTPQVADSQHSISSPVRPTDAAIAETAQSTDQEQIYDSETQSSKDFNSIETVKDSAVKHGGEHVNRVSDDPEKTASTEFPDNAQGKELSIITNSISAKEAAKTKTTENQEILEKEKLLQAIKSDNLQSKAEDTKTDERDKKLAVDGTNKVTKELRKEPTKEGNAQPVEESNEGSMNVTKELIEGGTNEVTKELTKEMSIIAKDAANKESMDGTKNLIKEVNKLPAGHDIPHGNLESNSEISKQEVSSYGMVDGGSKHSKAGNIKTKPTIQSNTETVGTKQVGASKNSSHPKDSTLTKAAKEVLTKNHPQKRIVETISHKSPIKRKSVNLMEVIRSPIPTKSQSPPQVPFRPKASNTGAGTNSQDPKGISQLLNVLHKDKAQCQVTDKDTDRADDETDSIRPLDKLEEAKAMDSQRTAEVLQEKAALKSMTDDSNQEHLMKSTNIEIKKTTNDELKTLENVSSEPQAKKGEALAEISKLQTSENTSEQTEQKQTEAVTDQQARGDEGVMALKDFSTKAEAKQLQAVKEVSKFQGLKEICAEADNPALTTEIEAYVMQSINEIPRVLSLKDIIAKAEARKAQAILKANVMQSRTEVPKVLGLKDVRTESEVETPQTPQNIFQEADEQHSQSDKQQPESQNEALRSLKTATKQPVASGKDLEVLSDDSNDWRASEAISIDENICKDAEEINSKALETIIEGSMVSLPFQKENAPMDNEAKQMGVIPEVPKKGNLTVEDIPTESESKDVNAIEISLPFMKVQFPKQKESVDVETEKSHSEAIASKQMPEDKSIQSFPLAQGTQIPDVGLDKSTATTDAKLSMKRKAVTCGNEMGYEETAKKPKQPRKRMRKTKEDILKSQASNISDSELEEHCSRSSEDFLGFDQCSPCNIEDYTNLNAEQIAAKEILRISACNAADAVSNTPSSKEKAKPANKRSSVFVRTSVPLKKRYTSQGDTDITDDTSLADDDEEVLSLSELKQITEATPQKIAKGVGSDSDDFSGIRLGKHSRRLLSDEMEADKMPIPQAQQPKNKEAILTGAAVDAVAPIVIDTLDKPQMLSKPKSKELNADKPKEPGKAPRGRKPKTPVTTPKTKASGHQPETTTTPLRLPSQEDLKTDSTNNITPKNKRGRKSILGHDTKTSEKTPIPPTTTPLLIVKNPEQLNATMPAVRSNELELAKQADELNGHLSPHTPTGNKRRGRPSAAPKYRFNPRLLLIRRREQLDSDEPLVEQNPGTGSIQCGLCLKRTVQNKWQQHLAEHYGFGWRVGEEKPDLESRSVVLNSIIAFLRDSDVKALSCRLCDKTYRSGLGMLIHLEGCGSEVQRVVCEYCNRDYTVLSLNAHLRTCAVRNQDKQNDETVIETPAKTVYSAGTGRAKRVSTLKAENRLKNLNLAVEKAELREFTKSADCLPPDVRKKCLDIAANKKLFSCPAKACKCTAPDLQGLERHMDDCAALAKPGYYCDICKSTWYAAEAKANKHVLDKHRGTADFSSDSDCVVEPRDDEQSSTGNEVSDDVDYDELQQLADVSARNARGGAKKKSKYARKSSRKVLLRKKVYSNTAHLNQEMVKERWKEFTENNLSPEVLFANYKVDYVVLNSEENDKYLPPQEKSMKFLLRSDKPHMMETFGLPEIGLEWMQIERFASQKLHDETFFFVGAPVTYCSWLPLPAHIEDQYLLVSHRKDMFKYVKYLNPKHVRTTLLLFKISKSANADCGSTDLQLHYACAIEEGPVHHFAFLPSGGYDAANNRLGLVAVASVLPTIKIYALPIELASTSNVEPPTIPLIQLNVSFELCLDLLSPDEADQAAWRGAQCMQVSWSEFSGHRHIVAGYSNGFLCIWDVSDDAEENMNRMVVDDAVKFMPLNYFFFGEKGIRALALHYDNAGLRWLAVMGFYRRQLVYDLKNLMRPMILKENKMRAVARCMEWSPIMEPYFLGYCDAMPNSGRCMLAVQPCNVSYNHQKLANCVAAVTSIHFTPWLNMIVTGVDNGDLLLFDTRSIQLHNVLDHTLDKKCKISLMDVKQLNGQPIASLKPQRLPKGKVSAAAAAKQPKGEQQQQLNTEQEPEIDWKLHDKDYKEKFGLVFQPILKINEHRHGAYISEKRRAPLHISPYTRINTTRCNLNAAGQNLIALGHENGFLRIINYQRKSSA